MGQIKLHIPTSLPDAQPLKLAPRPGTLRGARLALLDNGKEFSDQVLEAVGEVLKRDYDVGEVIFWRKGFPAKAAPFIAEMAPSCDVVVNGVGHCGSSSPWSVHDGVPPTARLNDFERQFKIMEPILHEQMRTLIHLQIFKTASAAKASTDRTSRLRHLFWQPHAISRWPPPERRGATLRC